MRNNKTIAVLLNPWGERCGKVTRKGNGFLFELNWSKRKFYSRYLERGIEHMLSGFGVTTQVTPDFRKEILK